MSQFCCTRCVKVHYQEKKDAMNNKLCTYCDLETSTREQLYHWKKFINELFDKKFGNC